MDKKFKILNISGGGVKGIYSIHVLKQIEDKFCKEGETLSDYFDMICGTSTGGIIALGIASGMRMSEIANLYEENAALIFPNSGGNWLKKWAVTKLYQIKQLFGDKYNNNMLYELMEEFFGNKTLGQSKNLLCIPTYELQTSSNIIFRFPHKECDVTRDKSVPMVVAGMATSAAPTYLPVFHYEGPTISGYFADGGIYANDVTMVGIIEALEYFVGPNKEYSSMEILTVGNIKENIGDAPKNSESYWSLLRFSKLIDIIFNSNSNIIDHCSDVLCKNLNSSIVRIECTDFPDEDAQDIAMDNSNPDFIEELKIYGIRDGNDIIDPRGERGSTANISKFFINKKTYMTGNEKN